ncbi:MAG: hypothetical protein R3B90_22080 [Planctomycetaceae bacterium]
MRGVGTGRLSSGRLSWWLGVALTGLLWPGSVSAQDVTVQQILEYKPRQADVSIDTPAAADVAKCTIEVKAAGKSSGWVVFGPDGQTIRHFVDTDGNNYVDQWRYYQHGLEVYRDIDTDGDSKVDQSRWMNLGGTRWGVDTNQDGKIDRWLRISAEEASREAVHAIVSRDVQAAWRLCWLTARTCRPWG